MAPGAAEEAVRPAAPEDVPAIVDLAGALRAELTPMRGGRICSARDARPGRLDEVYAALLADPEVCVVVGTIDEVVVGFGVVSAELLSDGGLLGVVSELFVDPEGRAIGVGEAMLGAMVAFCSDKGCVGVDAFALPGHRAAKNFFEESGFTARAIVMHHALQTGEGNPGNADTADAEP